MKTNFIVINLIRDWLERPMAFPKSPQILIWMADLFPTCHLRFNYHHMPQTSTNYVHRYVSYNCTRHTRHYCGQNLGEILNKLKIIPSAIKHTHIEEEGKGQRTERAKEYDGTDRGHHIATHMHMNNYGVWSSPLPTWPPVNNNK